MHYANGRAAKIGDLVRGKGYNVKHQIIGRVTNLREGDSCNLSVAHVDSNSATYIGTLPTLQGPIDIQTPFLSVLVHASVEFGETKAFEALDPNTGEVLPPE